MEPRTLTPVVAIALITLAFAPAAAADVSATSAGLIVSPAANGDLARFQTVVLSYAPGPGPLNVSGDLRLSGILIGTFFEPFANGTNETVIHVAIEVPANMSAGERLLAATFRQGSSTTTAAHLVNYVGGPINQKPLLSLSQASYIPTVGFRLAGLASDPDAGDRVVSLTITTPYQIVTIQNPNATWNATLAALPDRLGDHNVSVVARDANNGSTRLDLVVPVWGHLLVLHDETVDVEIGAHTEAFLVDLPARLLGGRVDIQCTAACVIGAAAIYVDLDADSRSQCGRIEVWGRTTVGNCAFSTRQGPGSAAVAWTQAGSAYHVRITGVLV